ncbi:unnamed protein product [Nezara viridula]|uniref:Uncharacterized protein n=1 Tax=Nezara viridula TaxID=85310 RepID=A0A9P0E9K3_NEZVI|nr:unnamed protein product [Nezara viridula]
MSALIYCNGKLVISRKWLITNFLIIISITLTFICVFIPISKSLISISKWYYFLKTGYSAVLILIIMGSWIHGYRNVDLLNTCLIKMRAADLEMLFLRKEMPLTKPSWVTFLLYMLMTTGYFLKAPVMSSFFSFCQLFVLYSPYILIISIQDNVDRIAYLLRLRFQAIKKHLIHCFKMEAKKAVVVLEKLALCHYHLSGSSEDIDEYFSVQVTSILTVFFLVSFCEAYAISILYKDENLSYKGLVLTEKIMWLLITFTTIWRVCHQFATISVEVKSFTEYVFSLNKQECLQNIIST